MAQAKPKDFCFVNCSVTGRPEHVARKQLCSWIASDNQNAISLTKQIAQKKSKKVAVISDKDPTVSAKFKLATNFMVYGIAELLGEELILLDKAGIDRTYLLEWTDGLCKNSIVEVYAKKMVNREFGEDGRVGASIEVGTKDLRLIEALHAGEDALGSLAKKRTDVTDDCPAAKRQRIAPLGKRLPIASAPRAHMEAQSEYLAARGQDDSDNEWCSFLEAMEELSKTE